MMFNSTVNNHNTVNWRNNLNDLTKLDDLDNEVVLSSIADFGHPIDNLKIVSSTVKTTDCQTKQTIKQDNKLPHLSTSNSVHPIYERKIIKPISVKYETVDYQIEEDINQDNELPLSSIADFLHPIDNLKIVSNAVKTIDCQTKQIIKQDNKLPHLSMSNSVHPIYERKIIKPISVNYETVDYQIEQDIYQDNELPLSSIADFLHPIDHKFKNGILQKNETVDCQLKENINQSEPKKCNKEQCTIENLSKRYYECDICNKIFYKRTDIIKHFKTSLCFPEVIYVFKCF